MTNKCQKFEALFTFSDEQTLQKHIAECEDCRKEYEKMQSVSNLLQEVKPLYKNRKNNVARLKAACIVFLIMIGGITVDFADQQYGILDTVKYGEQLTMADLGIPTDSYGLIQVDE